MQSKDKIKSLTEELKLTYLKNNFSAIIEEAAHQERNYSEFLQGILEKELEFRQEAAQKRRLTHAMFPYINTLDSFNAKECNGITPYQIGVLRDLTWIDKLHNLIFLGTPGVGKTHLSLGLGYEAVKAGYKVSFFTMSRLMYYLKKEILPVREKAILNRLYDSNLIIIDEVGYLPLSKEEANLFFQVISAMHDKCSLIITSNKTFTEWSELLGDQALATALLDRLLHRSDVFVLDNSSWRMKNRQSLFEKN